MWYMTYVILQSIAGHEFDLSLVERLIIEPGFPTRF